jgi:phosphatidylglycerophosphatase A
MNSASTGPATGAPDPVTVAAHPLAPGREWTTVEWASVAFATFFGAGKMPVAPGTWGSLAAVILYRVFLTEISTVALALTAAAVAAVGIASSTIAERALGKHDPGEVVIDEVAGQLISLLIVHALGLVHLQTLVVSFLAFRVFDVLKPFPCYQLQSLPKGWGVMCDDLFAGVYAALVTFAAGWLLR